MTDCVVETPCATPTNEERSRRFNETCGVRGYIGKGGRPTGADRHPDRCVCQDETTPHKHYDKPPFVCARCLECKGYTPAIETPTPSADCGVETPGWAEFFAERKQAGMGSFWLPPEIAREMPLGFICGMVCTCGPNLEPLACGYKPGHEGNHAWASLPTFVAGIPCATCWDENCQASLGRVRRETHDYDTSAKWMPCPDCGVETPEAAVTDALVMQMRRNWDIAAGGVMRHYTADVDFIIANLPEVLDRLERAEAIAQGWTPPGGTG